MLPNAPPDAIFAYLDDPRKLEAHMTRRSWMMAGSRMKVDVDAAEGRAVGSTIRMSGRVLGVHLRLEEIVIERDPPLRKVWVPVGARPTVAPARRTDFRDVRRVTRFCEPGLATALTITFDPQVLGSIRSRLMKP